MSIKCTVYKCNDKDYIDILPTSISPPITI